MSRRSLWLALCMAVLMCSPVVADVGSLSLTVTPLQTPGTLDVDLTLVATTTGAATPATSDTVYLFASWYYPTPWASNTTNTYYGTNVSRTGVTNVFQNTFSFTLPISGHWGHYGWVYGVTQNSYMRDVTPVIATMSAGVDPEIDTWTDGIVFDVRPTASFDDKWISLSVRGTLARGGEKVPTRDLPG